MNGEYVVPQYSYKLGYSSSLRLHTEKSFCATLFSKILIHKNHCYSNFGFSVVNLDC